MLMNEDKTDMHFILYTILIFQETRACQLHRTKNYTISLIIMEGFLFRVLLTPAALQLSCSPQWPVLLSCDELDYWCRDRALNPHLPGPAAPGEQNTRSLWHFIPLSCTMQTNRKNTLPLLTFSEQALAYMGIPMTTSSQACTAPALHTDMHVFLVSSACWRRSRCSSPSDRLCCGLSESGLVRRSHGVAFRRGSGSERYGNQQWWLIWIQSDGKVGLEICYTFKFSFLKVEKEKSILCIENSINLS